MSLWSGVLLNWVTALRTNRPSVAIRTETEPVDRLLDRVQNGTLDMALLYSAQCRPGVENTLVLEEELVAVSDRATESLMVDNYVYVDWGPDFRARHDQALPELKNAALVVDFGPLALRYLLNVGGCGYFRTRAVDPHLRSGKLQRVANAPRFSHSLHAVHSKELNPDLHQWALQRLLHVAQMPVEAWA